ncbi:hypothetical protein [Streptomyces sp. N35]|nr:hypothetical protein [Streptomyces sp. N35]
MLIALPVVVVLVAGLLSVRLLTAGFYDDLAGERPGDADTHHSDEPEDGA